VPGTELGHSPEIGPLGVGGTTGTDPEEAVVELGRGHGDGSLDAPQVDGVGAVGGVPGLGPEDRLRTGDDDGRAIRGQGEQGVEKDTATLDIERVERTRANRQKSRSVGPAVEFRQCRKPRARFVVFHSGEQALTFGRHASGSGQAIDRRLCRRHVGDVTLCNRVADARCVGVAPPGSGLTRAISAAYGDCAWSGWSGSPRRPRSPQPSRTGAVATLRPFTTAISIRRPEVAFHNRDGKAMDSREVVTDPT
jgi:hypothetical protein